MQTMCDVCMYFSENAAVTQVKIQKLISEGGGLLLNWRALYGENLHFKKRQKRFSELHIFELTFILKNVFLIWSSRFLYFKLEKDGFAQMLFCGFIHFEHVLLSFRRNGSQLIKLC